MGPATLGGYTAPPHCLQEDIKRSRTQVQCFHFNIHVGCGAPGERKGYTGRSYEPYALDRLRQMKG